MVALWLLAGLAKRRERSPFLAAASLFVLSYLGLGISFYPYIVPPSLTIWDAAAPTASLKFLIVGAAVLIPLILSYTAWSYWIFRGKVRAGSGYHYVPQRPPLVLLRRLLWFIGLWLAGVASLALATLLLRWLLI